MGIKIPWDKYEVAILMEACERYNNKVIEKSDAVTEVSLKLRKLAVIRGLTIDEIFRNENGISMQFSSANGLICNKPSHLSEAKIFRDIAEIYLNDKPAFLKILDEANSFFTIQPAPAITNKVEVVDMPNNCTQSLSNGFVTWLNATRTNAETNSVISAIKSYSILLLQKKKIPKPILLNDNINEISELLSETKAKKTMVIHSKKHYYHFVNALELYCNYLQSVAQTFDDSHNVSDAVPTVRENAFISQNDVTDEIKIVDFSQPHDYAFTRVKYLKYNGRTVDDIKKWSTLYIQLLSWLYNDYTSEIEALCNSCLGNSRRIDIADKYYCRQMTAPKEFAQGWYVEGNLSARSIVLKIKAFLDYLHIPYENVIIAYTFKADESVSQHKSENSLFEYNQLRFMSNSFDETLLTSIRTILSKKYGYGFKIDLALEIMRFRRYAETNNISLPESDADLKSAIQQVGFLVDGKIFVFSDEMVYELKNIIDLLVSSGIQVLFYESIMKNQAEWMQENHIVSEEMLKSILQKNFRGFYFGKNFMSYGNKVTESDAVLYELERIWAESSTMEINQISELLPYIPFDNLQRSMFMNQKILWSSEGVYFLLDNFVISESEIDDIQSFVANSCEKDGFVSITDIPMGSIEEENYELSQTAIYNAVFSLVLRDKYTLNDKIITYNNSSLDTVTLLKRYCADKDECTFDEIQEHAEELTGVKNRRYIFTALYDTMIRIDADRYVAKKYVRFLADEIDKILTTFIPNGFTAIRNITTFAMFPLCGQSWNHYLLESYCYAYSNKYALKLINFNDKNGGIIAEKDLNLSYDEMLIQATVDAGIELTPEIVGNYLCETGYLTKRSSGIEEITSKAAASKERK